MAENMRNVYSVENVMGKSPADGPLHDKVYFERTEVPPDKGFHIQFVTKEHNSPLHWHREMEILYILNGSAVVQMEGKKYHLNPQDLIVIDSSVIHDVVYALPQTMGICIHISKSYMRRYLADMELMRIICIPESPVLGKEESYGKLRWYLKELTVLYFEQKQSYPFASGAIIMEILAELVDDFSELVSEEITIAGADNLVRVEEIFQYVEEHYKEPISLQDAADQAGLNKEYFCRFFKKNTGMTFLQYVNQVRISHIYRDLLHAEGNVQEIMERHGMYNAKVFYRLFKERYGCTPREMWKMMEEEQERDS